jgi:hypothetical protein
MCIVQALILLADLYLMQQVMSEVSINNFLLLTLCQEQTICIYQQFSTYGCRSRTEYQSFKKQEQTVYQSAALYLWQHSLYQQLFTRCKQFRSQQSINKLEAKSTLNKKSEQAINQSAFAAFAL